MTLTSLSAESRQKILQELYDQEKRLSTDPAVMKMQNVRELIRFLEPAAPQIEIPFIENGVHKKKEKETRRGRKIMYPGITETAIEVLKDFKRINKPDEYDYFDTVFNAAVVKMEISGKKTLAHFRTCFYAALNKKNPLIELGTDDNGKRLYRFADPVES